MKLVPGKDGADVHEPAEIQQHVDAGIDFIVARFGFRQKAPVPVQSAAGEETGNQIVGADAAARAQYKKLWNRLTRGQLHPR